ncbi:MAG: pseudouridine synthase [Clostridia bacterium]
MKERLQKIISGAGITSRRDAENLINQGRVTVNHQVANLGDKADPEYDLISIDNRPVKIQTAKAYIMLNKPVGYVTTLKDEKSRKNIVDLVKNVGVRVYPIGRLDLDSEGLLLLTNDGEFANKMMHPKSNIGKKYHLKVTGDVSRIKELTKPMKIDGVEISTAKIEILYTEGDMGELFITIYEGRNRQIRKMCEKCGLKVNMLKRIAIAKLELGDLSRGKWRNLSRNEVEYLKRL